MRLSDLMSGADLSFYPQVAMALFLLAYLTIAVRLFVRPHRDPAMGALDLDAAARLPLADDSAPITDHSHASPMEDDHRVHR